MFEKQDFDFLTEVFALARAKTVRDNLNNKEGLIQLLNFEESLKGKMLEIVKKVPCKEELIGPDGRIPEEGIAGYQPETPYVMKENGPIPIIEKT